MWVHLSVAIAMLNGEKTEPKPQAGTLTEVITKYRNEHMSTLQKSTQDAGNWIIGQHIEPRWGSCRLSSIRPGEVDDWVKGLKLSGVSRGHVMVVFRQLMKKAMLWGMYPVGFNPLTLVTVKGATHRDKEPVILTVDQVNQLFAELKHPYDAMVLHAAILGLRVSEVVALKWEDFDLENGVMSVQRKFTHGAHGVPKTASSKAKLPIGKKLLDYLVDLKPENATGWLFPSPVTGGPLSATTALTKHIKPAAEKAGIPKIGWHDLRHSFRSWISSQAQLTVQKDMVRHADVTTTANIYGHTPVEDMRPVADEVASGFKLKRPSSSR
jgi:integrase